MHKFEKQILEFTQRNRLVSRGDKLVVAVSGGADSVALLHILHNIRLKLGIELHVAHLDHRLRGGASHEDAAFVKEQASKLNLPMTIEAIDVGGYRQANHISLEEAAREVRYKFLEDVVRQTGASAVAVAHTSNDHVETVALHLLRGTGLTGLVGLKEKSVLRYKRVGPLTVIRPLLCLRRADVEKYCSELNLEFRTDATNESLSFTRNRIRRTLLPRLRADFNPRIGEALDRLSHLASDDVDFINSETVKVWDSVVRTEGNGVKIGRLEFSVLHPALKRAVLRQALILVLGSPKDIEAVHIEEMLALSEGETGRSLDLPDGIKLYSSYQDLTLGRNLLSDIPFPPIASEHKLNVPGVTDIPGWRIRATITENQGELTAGKGNGSLYQLFDFELVGEDLFVRSRKSGDRFQPLGMKAEKSVKDFFIDTKVPRPWRPRVPIVVNPGQVVWVTGYRIDDRVKVTPSTSMILRLVFRQQPST